MPFIYGAQMCVCSLHVMQLLLWGRNRVQAMRVDAPTNKLPLSKLSLSDFCNDHKRVSC